MSDATRPAAKKILLVDDEVHVRSVMQLKLRGAGYTVETASDGADGLRVAAEFEPDLIISDYQMPQMDGLAMCRALAADAKLRGVPVLLVTSREFEMDAAKLSGTNVRAVRDKPFSPKAIIKLVAELLQAAGVR